MPRRHSPPLIDEATAENKQRPITPNIVERAGASEEECYTSPHFPPQENTPSDPLTLMPPGGPPETLNAPALDPSPQITTYGTPPLDGHSLAPLVPNAVPTTAEDTQPAAPIGKPGVIVVGDVEFHHASEAEFARLLDYYGIEWEYEPHQFPLRWHEGRPIEMFRPDFYLTEYDLYIELTTMRQALVRRKNRKLRLLRALYPEISIKLLYRRDYQRLLERFGIPQDEAEAEAPADRSREEPEQLG